MAKLYFRYGAMGSSKTANALMVAYNYKERGKRVLLAKPKLDTREMGVLHSRIGLEQPCIYVEELVEMPLEKLDSYDCVIVDEAQFLTVPQVDELRKFADEGVMVMCYGLRNDYTGHLFEGSKRIIEVCDTIREIQSMCSKCGTKAIVDARYIDNKIIYEGNVIDIGGKDKYITLCHSCWVKGRI